MSIRILTPAALLLLGACAALRPAAPDGPVTPAALPAPAPVATVTLDPTPPPPPPAAANTAEELDTTTEEDRASATATPAEAEEAAPLGTTVASLGSPADPGIWMETPLVTTLTMGRVEYPATGESVNIELRPSGGDPGSGSQISLAAMRLLGAPLTGLPELVVYGS